MSLSWHQRRSTFICLITSRFKSEDISRCSQEFGLENFLTQRRQTYVTKCWLEQLKVACCVYLTVYGSVYLFVVFFGLLLNNGVSPSLNISHSQTQSVPAKLRTADWCEIGFKFRIRHSSTYNLTSYQLLPETAYRNKWQWFYWSGETRSNLIGLEKRLWRLVVFRSRRWPKNELSCVKRRILSFEHNSHLFRHVKPLLYGSSLFFYTVKWIVLLLLLSSIF